MRLVLIEWVDAHSTDAWKDLEQIDTSPWRVQTIGWLIEDDGKQRTVVMNLSTKGEESKPSVGCMSMTIPTACITRMRTIAVDKRPNPRNDSRRGVRGRL